MKLPQSGAPFEMLAVLDFEATCADASDVTWDSALQEIIEFPVALVAIAEMRVIDTFSSFVRPTHQPTLTAFCTTLTTIRQEDVDGKATIDEVLSEFTAWLDGHGVTSANTCAVTCGDWDLRRMWPRQASLVPGLHSRTPALFRRWSNLKVAFASHAGVRPSGMMSMLEHVGLPHEGVHHRGVHDVRNLCRLAIHLLREGAAIVPTWTDVERDAERSVHMTKWLAAKATLEAKSVARARLPTSVSDAVRSAFDQELFRLSQQVARLEAYVSVFSEADSV